MGLIIALVVAAALLAVGTYLIMSRRRKKLQAAQVSPCCRHGTGPALTSLSNVCKMRSFTAHLHAHVWQVWFQIRVLNGMCWEQGKHGDLDSAGNGCLNGGSSLQNGTVSFA